MKTYIFPTCDLILLSPCDVLTTSTLFDLFQDNGEKLNSISWNDIKNNN